MRIVFDPVKDAANRAKHGLPLALAAELDWGAAVNWIDDRRDYGEVRRIALVPLGERLHFVAFVDRDGERRIVSMRKANNREKRRYAQILEAAQRAQADPE